MKVIVEIMFDYIVFLKGIVNWKERNEVVSFLFNRVNLYDVRKKNLGIYFGGMK